MKLTISFSSGCHTFKTNHSFTISMKNKFPFNSKNKFNFTSCKRLTIVTDRSHAMVATPIRTAFLVALTTVI